MQLLAMRLPNLVGSPLSLNSLRGDLQAAHKTISRWVDILERMYMIFRLDTIPFKINISAEIWYTPISKEYRRQQ